MNVRSIKRGEILILTPSGPLDFSNYQDTRKKLSDAYGSDLYVVVDMGNVDAICSHSAGFIFTSVKAFRDEKGGRLVICNLNENIEKILRLLHFFEHGLEFFDSRKEAINSFDGLGQS